jgi:chromate transporter
MTGMTSSALHRFDHGVSFAEAFSVWLRIAFLSFGGPAGQIALMHRILVEEKRWISEARFLNALNFCMLLPGPEAQQLATYTGWLMHGTRGGILAGGLFILPGAVAIMGLSALYAAFGALDSVTALFIGLKAAVLAIVLQAVIRLSQRALTNTLLVALAAIAFIGIAFFAVLFPVIVLGAGVFGYIAARAGMPQFAAAGALAKVNPETSAPLLRDDLPAEARPEMRSTLGVAMIWGLLWLAPVAAVLLTLGPGNVFATIAVFFSQAAMVTFGGAYAVLAYVGQEAVGTYHWLEPGQMLDGLSMAETTPGPLILVLQFVGFMAAYRDPGGLPPMLAGVLGGLLTTWVTFTPCFLWIFLGAPFVERLRGNKALSAALKAITASVVGVISSLGLWFAIHTVFADVQPVQYGVLVFDAPVLSSVQVWPVVLAVAAAFALFRLNAGVVPVLAAAATAGLGLHGAGLLP